MGTTSRQHGGISSSFDEYLDFLEFELKLVRISRATLQQIKRLLATARIGRPEALGTNPDSNHTHMGSSQSKDRQTASRRCIMKGCSESHYLGAMLTNLNMAQRLEMATTHKLCRNCLVSGHFATQCHRQGCRRCPEAKVKHHFRLCPKSVETPRLAIEGTKAEGHAP